MAYGGFDISLTPTFSSTMAAWLESGGIYAVPNLRGGGEFGKDWHQAGAVTNKQNVFDDFIAAAEHLFELGLTNSENLAISGRSNGGLLVGAVMTQRPDLAAVALPAVGVLDMPDTIPLRQAPGRLITARPSSRKRCLNI